MSLKERAKAEWDEKKELCLEQRKKEKIKRAHLLRTLIREVLEMDVEVDDIRIEIDGLEFMHSEKPSSHLSMHMKCDECGLSEWERVSGLSDVGHYLERMENHKCPTGEDVQEKTPEERLIEALKEIGRENIERNISVLEN